MINIFGSNHEEIGSSDLNLILKTAGKIKILVGRKFIDLIDNKGNINSGASNIIQKVNSVDDIRGTGIFYVDGNIIVSIDDKKITLTSESGTNYVSFIEKLDISRDLQIIALKNIGFIYDSLDNILNANGGIVYVESEKSLYIVNDGTIEKYQVDIPNPYPKQFIINKDSEDKGSLLIVGKGIENSLAFDDLFIYNNSNSSNIDSNYPILFNVNNNTSLEIQDNKVITNSILSRGSDLNYGYRLYFVDGQSTLEVDNLIVRNGDSSSIDIDIIPLRYYKNENIIKKIGLLESDSENLQYNIQLKYDLSYNVNDILSTYILIKTLLLEETISYLLKQIKFKVVRVSSKTITVELLTNYRIDISNCINKVIGLIDDDLVLGEIGQKYNSKEHGIISKLNLFYSAKFDKEGSGLNIYPFYSENLYNELSPNVEDSDYTYTIPPLGLIKKLLLVHSAEYKKSDKKIYFKDYSGNNLFNIDATDFIKDGMVSNVEVINNNIVITFNTDSGKEDISIPISRIFDASKYYTKEETYNKEEIDSMIVESSSSSTPIGTILMWPGSSLPDGYLICDGSNFNREDYPKLYEVLNSTRLPDLRNRFIVGAGNEYNLKDTGGEKKHTLTIDEMPRHNHTKLVCIGNENNLVYGDDKIANTGDGYLTLDQSTFSVGYTGGNYPHNNLPPYYALYYIIKVSNKEVTPISNCESYNFVNLNTTEGLVDNVGSAVALSIKTKDPLIFSREDSSSWITYLTTNSDNTVYAYICKAEDYNGNYREGTAVFKSNDGCIFEATIKQGIRS